MYYITDIEREIKIMEECTELAHPNILPLMFKYYDENSCTLVVALCKEDGMIIHIKMFSN
jgi:hypothetical protein